MDDVLSQGGDRGPSRWPRRLAAMAVLAMLAAALVWHLQRGRDAPAHHLAVTVAADPDQLAGLGAGAAGLLDEPLWSDRTGAAPGRPPSAACRRRAARLGLAGRGRAAQRKCDDHHKPP
jgi:hypothetical protein